MNEPIKELALKAGLLSARPSGCGKCTVETKTRVLLATVLGTDGHAEITNPDVQLHKFAELIVLECVNAVMDGTKEGDHYAMRIENHFDNGTSGVLHFGVEE